MVIAFDPQTYFVMAGLDPQLSTPYAKRHLVK
jgi:hypothetical protein